MYRVINASRKIYSSDKPNSWEEIEEKEEKYLKSNPNISYESMFYYINSDDYRYRDIFDKLKDLGFNPRQSHMESRTLIYDCITVDVPEGTRKVPKEITDLLKRQKNVELWDTRFYNTKTKIRKLKFSIRDGYIMGLIHKYLAGEDYG